MYCRLPESRTVSWNSNVQTSDVTCQLVTVRETLTWHCDRTDIVKLYIKFKCYIYSHV